MPYKVLFLDDERNPEDVTWKEYPDGSVFTVVRNYSEFKSRVDNHFTDYNLISFDHDLQDFSREVNSPSGSNLSEYTPCSNTLEYTGQDCLRYLLELCLAGSHKLPEVIFHTKNPIGEGNMQSVLRSYYRVS